MLERASGDEPTAGADEPYGFSRADYRAMLETAIAAGYEFRAFDDPARDEPERVCLLRHDVDVDVAAAVAVAEIEAELSIRSTFFVMLRSPVYNLLSRSNHRLVRRLIELGHWIGLHYDEGFEPDPPVTLAQSVNREVLVLREMFGVEVGAVSFHQPSPAVLENHVRLEGLVNTYDRDDMARFDYVSDSNMLWRSLHAHEIFRDAVHPKLHLLVHPVWWVSDGRGVTTAEAFDRALLSNWARAQEQMLQTERAYGPPRRFRIEHG